MKLVQIKVDKVLQLFLSTKNKYARKLSDDKSRANSLFVTAMLVY